MTYSKVNYINVTHSRNWDVHTCICVCVCTAWPTDNWAPCTPNNALYLPIGVSPHLTVASRSKCNRLRTYCMLGNIYDLLCLLTRHHIMDSFYANFVSPCQECMCMRACTTPFFSAGTCTSNAHGQTCQHSQSAVLHVSNRGSVTFEMPCVYYTVYALHVSVFGDYMQLWGTV
jgi:hypothetical protein